MSVFGNILIAFSKVISMITGMCTFIVSAAVIVSWVKPDPYNPIVLFLYQVTEPVFRKVRAFLPPIFFKSGLDWTPLIVVILLILIENIVGQTLFDWGQALRYGSLLPK